MLIDSTEHAKTSRTMVEKMSDEVKRDCRVVDVDLLRKIFIFWINLVLDKKCMCKAQRISVLQKLSQMLERARNH